MNENIMVDNHYLALSVYVDFIIKLKNKNTIIIVEVRLGL